jgi:hypothetical protein
MAYEFFFDPDFEAVSRSEFEKLYDPQRDLDGIFTAVEASRSLAPWYSDLEDRPGLVEPCRNKIRREVEKRRRKERRSGCRRRR